MTVATDDRLVPSPELIDQVRVGRGDFVGIGDAFIDMYMSSGWIKPDSTVVDIGCGLGRLARPLTSRLNKGGEYFGFDINPTSIDWCKKQYSDQTNFHFTWLDLMSVVYNPSGSSLDREVRFHIPKNSIDFVNLTSVFTHMFMDGVENYLNEISRFLRPGGVCAITYFLASPEMEHLVANYSASLGKGPLLGSNEWHPMGGGFIRNKEQPEDAVILLRSKVEEVYRKAGLTIQKVDYGNWANNVRQQTYGGGQDMIVAQKPF